MPIDKDENFKPSLYQLKILDNFNASISSLKEDPEQRYETQESDVSVECDEDTRLFNLAVIRNEDLLALGMLNNEKEATK